MDSHTKKIIMTMATSERAMAKGIEVSVVVMESLAAKAADGKVDVSELRTAAAALLRRAEQKRADADEILAGCDNTQ